MKAPQLKTIGFSVLYVSIVVLFLCPLFMYFSHDVEVLKTQYPHIVEKKDEFPEYEIKKKRPNYWVKLNEISKYGKWAIVISEDWGFYQHNGIDLNQIKVALNEMVEDQKFRGASTITQQMVKNIFLYQERTLWRKLHEIILTQKVERVLSKSLILEMYLNCIEFGPGIYGIKKASYHYFKKHPGRLNPKEAAFLAMLLPSPKRYYQSFRKKKLTPFARERVNTILMKMRMAKIISYEQYEYEKSIPLSFEAR